MQPTPTGEPSEEVIYNPGISKNDALPLEYKLHYRQPRRQADISDFIGDAAIQRALSIYKGYLKEKTLDALYVQVSVTDHDF